MKFDGKMYAETGSDVAKGSMISGKRVNAHLLQCEGQVNSKPDDKEEWKVSEDGKTLTIVSRPVNSLAVFTSVLDRK